MLFSGLLAWMVMCMSQCNVCLPHFLLTPKTWNSCESWCSFIYMKLALIFASSLLFCALQILAELQGEDGRLRKASYSGALWAVSTLRERKGKVQPLLILRSFYIAYTGTESFNLNCSYYFQWLYSKLHPLKWDTATLPVITLSIFWLWHIV